MKLNLTKPIIFFDLETTGTNITHDRIVELSYIKVSPDGTEEKKSRRINPEMPIPPESTAIHHITDEDVKDCPTFRQVSKALLAIFDGCDIAGYNSNKFDVPLLMEEFARCGLNFEIKGRHFIDVQNIFHKMEQRTLVAAYKFYCGGDLENAHSALADTQATYDVLLGQLDRYGNLKNDIGFPCGVFGFGTQRRPCRTHRPQRQGRACIQLRETQRKDRRGSAAARTVVLRLDDAGRLPEKHQRHAPAA